MHLGTLSRSYLPRCKPPSPKRIVRIYEPNKWANIPQYLVWTLSLSYQFWSTVCPTWEVFEYSIIYSWVKSLARFCPSYLTICARLLWFMKLSIHLSFFRAWPYHHPTKTLLNILTLHIWSINGKKSVSGQSHPSFKKILTTLNIAVVNYLNQRKKFSVYVHTILAEPSCASLKHLSWFGKQIVIWNRGINRHGNHK